MADAILFKNLDLQKVRLVNISMNEGLNSVSNYKTGWIGNLYKVLCNYWRNPQHAAMTIAYIEKYSDFTKNS